jgi:hypothetical protein
VLSPARNYPAGEEKAGRLTRARLGVKPAVMQTLGQRLSSAVRSLP